MKKRNRWWKRLWAWCLVLAMLCVGAGGEHAVWAATAADGRCGENSWMLDTDGVLHLYGDGKFDEFTRDDVPWKWVKNEIRTVNFEMPSVAGGDLRYYFSGCTSLESVNDIPDGVTGLNEAFEGCTALKKVGRIPDSVQSMCETFKNCTSLNCTMTLPKELCFARGTFEGCTALKNAPVIGGDKLYDMTRCFYECSSLVNAPKLPESVKNMAYCFYHCVQLQHAPTLPKKVEDIRYTFWNCTNMKSAPDIPLYVKYMNNCMVGCKNVSGEITFYPLIKNKKNYTQFSGETAIYDVIKDPEFLGGTGTGLLINYTNRNKEYVPEYVGEGWNSGGLRGLEQHCGKLRIGNMVKAQLSDCEVESTGTEIYNGSAICPKPSVTYGYEKLLEGKDFTYSYKDNTDAGTATLTICGTEEFEGSRKISFGILPRRFNQVKVKGYEGVYDGNPHSISVQCDAGAKIEYGIKEGRYTTESCPEYLMPGNYTIYYRVSKANYVSESGSEQVVIRPETLSVEAQGFCGEYDGNPHSIYVKTDAGATIRYGTVEGEYVTAVCPSYINAGEYTVYYEVAKPGYQTWTGSEKVTIRRKKMHQIQFPDVEMTILGEKLENLIWSGGSTQYGKFVWDNPKQLVVKDTASYAMRFIPSDFVNYDWTSMEGYRSEAKDVLVMQSLAVAPYPTADSICYGKRLEESVLKSEEKSLICSWKEPELQPQKSGYYDAILQIGAKKWERPVWLELEKAVPQCETPQLGEAIYEEGCQLKSVKLPDGWSWVHPEQILSEEISGYEAVFTPSDTEHYHLVRRVIPLKTRKKIVTEDNSWKSDEEKHPASDEKTGVEELIFSAESSTVKEQLSEGEEYQQKITQWIRKIDQDEKTTAKVKIKKLSRKGKKITVKWKKLKEATGYQIVCEPKKTRKKAAITEYKKKCSAILCVKGKMKYRVKVRAVFRSKGKSVYGAWSKERTV